MARVSEHCRDLIVSTLTANPGGVDIHELAKVTRMHRQSVTNAIHDLRHGADGILAPIVTIRDVSTGRWLYRLGDNSDVRTWQTRTVGDMRSRGETIIAVDEAARTVIGYASRRASIPARIPTALAVAPSAA